MSAVPDTIRFDPSHIPAELALRPQWVGWRWRKARDQWTKNPINPATGGLASHAEPSTWGTIEEAMQAVETYGLDGIGYVFSADDPYAGVDLDDCVQPATGALDEWAADIVTAAASYTEYSPSGTGVKIIVRGALPDGRGRKKAEIEMYDRLRFFTITGKRVPGTAARIHERATFVLELYDAHFPEREATVTPIRIAAALNMDDHELVEMARRSRNGLRFGALFDGSTAGYSSQSEAEAALCSMIAFWTGPDHGHIDRIFRQSGLMRPKWEREDYRTSTLTLACDRTEFYEPKSTARIVFDTPAPGTEEYPYAIDLADGLKEPRKSDVWLVHGILREQAVQIIVGPPKTFKSFFAQELSIAVGTGTPMLGQFATGHPRRVLYVQEESARQHLWSRYEGILTGRGMHPETVRGQIICITNQGVRLDEQEGLETLLTKGIEAYEPDLVIFDPLRELHWQDENKAELMLPILRTFKVMRDRYNLSVAIIHHNNKNPLYTSPADSIRGTSAIWGAMDGGIFISTTDENKVMKVQFDLKEGGQIAPFLYSIQDGSEGVRFNVVEIEKTSNGAKFDNLQIVRWAHDLDEWWPISAAIDAFPVHERTVRDAVRALVTANNLLERPAKFGKKQYAHTEVSDDATF